MKKIFLSSIAALLLATGTARADIAADTEESYEVSCALNAYELPNQDVRFKRCKQVLEAFWKCVEKRRAGKVKHCYLPREAR